MKESDKQSGSKIKFGYLAIAVMFIGLFSVITSYITAKILVPTLPVFTSTPVEAIKTNTPTILPTSTFYILPTVVETPTQLQIPVVESNLLQNGDFENGLAGWTYSDKQKGYISVYETTGINGKGFCSNQYIPNASEYRVQNPLIGFSQEIPPVDQTQAYFFSAWVKLNKAINIYAKIDFIDGSIIKGFSAIEISNALSQINHQNKGNTTNGWVFIHAKIPDHFVKSKAVVIGFWHGPIPDPPEDIDSTICVDDVVFGRIVK